MTFGKKDAVHMPLRVGRYLARLIRPLRWLMNWATLAPPGNCAAAEELRAGMAAASLGRAFAPLCPPLGPHYKRV